MNRLPIPLVNWLSKTRPDETPIAWIGDDIWTLGHLRYDVIKLVKILQQREEQRWALCFENSYLFIVALLAALSADKTPVIPNHCRASLLKEQRKLFNGVLSDKTLLWDGALIVVNSDKQTTSENTSLPTIVDKRYIELFTSGSSGQPKRIRKSISGLDKEIALLFTHFSERLEGCRVVASVVPQHLYGLTFRIFLPMSFGLPLHIAMLYYTEQLTALDHRHRYLFVSSPAFIKRLDHQLLPPPITMILSAGGMLPWQDVLNINAWCKLWPDEIYGSTETGILAWRHRQQDDIPWSPFPGIEITRAGDNFRVVSPLIDNTKGLLLDDILHFEDKGLFRLAGRRGRVVKIEEKRISLNEIEYRLLALEGIREAAALPIRRGRRQGIAVLLVLDEKLHKRWREDSGKTLELSWRRALLPWLEPVAIPRYWKVIDEIPVNSMNKRVYKQLQELLNETLRN